MKKIWHDEAWEQFCDIVQRNARMAKRINELIKSIDRNGYNSIGKPEPLRGNLAGKWSVRIDAANRIIFRIVNNALEIYSCIGHYE